MSKAVDDDKMGTEFPVDSTGKNDYYESLRCSKC